MKKLILALKMLFAVNGLYYMPEAKNRKLMSVRPAVSGEKFTVFASSFKDYDLKLPLHPIYKEFTFDRRVTAAKLALDGKIIYNKDRNNETN